MVSSTASTNALEFVASRTAEVARICTSPAFISLTTRAKRWIAVSARSIFS
jgi:hypothetical protein